MTEQNKKKQTSPATGYLFIILGVIGIALPFIGGANWNAIGIIKLVISIVVLAFGLWTILKKKPNS